MNDFESADGSRLTTEQIAAAGDVAARDVAGRDAAGDTVAAAHQPATDDAGAGRDANAQLLEGDELRGVVERWREIQAQFVDEPRDAVREADALVADLMQRLARMFAGEREQLESRLASGESASTEDLRLGLQRYRSFFERLLAA